MGAVIGLLVLVVVIWWRKTVTQTHENGRVSPAVSVSRSSDRDQNLYLKLSIIDQRETPVLMPSPLFSWIDALSV
jgi:hypothetical protein